MNVLLSRKATREQSQNEGSHDQALPSTSMFQPPQLAITDGKTMWATEVAPVAKAELAAQGKAGKLDTERSLDKAGMPTLSADEQAMMSALENRVHMKKPAAAAVRKKPAADIPSFPKKGKLPLPSCHGSINYRGGRIYTIWGQKKFRAIKDLKVPSKEKVVKWSKAKPTGGEWSTALSSVDQYWGKK